MTGLDPLICAFPACALATVTDTGMCREHERVTVSGSFVNDKHRDGGHG